MSESRNLDMFTSNIDESSYTIEFSIKQKILEKTLNRVKQRWSLLRIIAAASILFILSTAFIPGTAVNALCKKIFSFIPGVGVVQNSDESGRIVSVLENPVRVTDGEMFVEVKSAYIKDKTLNLYIKTNVGTAGEDITDPVEFKKFYAAETAPALFMLSGNERIKSGHSVFGGPSFESRVYFIDTSFYLDDANIKQKTFKFEMESFKSLIEIEMSPVTKGTTPESMDNVAIIDDVMIFAETSRQGSTLEVLISAVAPKDFKDIRFHLYEPEKEVLKDSVHIIDKKGNIYKPDDGKRKQNNERINNLHFDIPEETEGLKLVVPQIFYSRRYDQNGIKVAMPELGKEIRINKVLDMPGSRILIENGSLIPAGDPMLPEEFKKYNCLRILASATKGEGSAETVLRVIPSLEIPETLGGFRLVSQSAYSDLWGIEQRGYSFATFDEIEKTRKINLKFDIEYTMKGPWEIGLK
ncbi:MAG: hypothetical protein GX227_00870 [Clostridiaceae bacterium]|nr:hypothetical protein [Clostridiaceae bacterium]